MPVARRTNIIGLCLIATFVAIFGSILSMALFSEGQAPESVSIDAVAQTPTE
ncbi:hypothetical protein [Shinella sp. BYT-45]|uniref:hypothetical protein n=1 Tax=Shinella sp. BYT-45 TaxID=3377377 RepID=UPI00397F970B